MSRAALQDNARFNYEPSLTITADDPQARITQLVDGIAYTNGERITAQGNHTLYVRAEDVVGNFTELENGFRALETFFSEQGVIAEGLHRATVGEGIAILHLVGTDKYKLEDLVRKKEFVELLKVSQVEGEIKPLVGVDVSRERPK